MESEEPMEFIFGTKVLKQSKKELTVKKVTEKGDQAKQDDKKSADAKERYFKNQAHFMRNLSPNSQIALPVKTGKDIEPETLKVLTQAAADLRNVGKRTCVTTPTRTQQREVSTTSKTFVTTSTTDEKGGVSTKLKKSNVTSAQSHSAAEEELCCNPKVAMRIASLMKEAIDRNYAAEDFGSRKCLQDAYTRGGLEAAPKFRSFLEDFHHKSYQRHACIVIMQMTNDQVFAKSAVSNLAHFFCIKKGARKDHLPSCPHLMTQEAFQKEIMSVPSSQVVHEQNQIAREGDSEESTSRGSANKHATGEKECEKNTFASNGEPETYSFEALPLNDTLPVPHRSPLHASSQVEHEEEIDLRKRNVTQKIHQLKTDASNWLNSVNTYRQKRDSFLVDDVLMIRGGSKDKLTFEISTPFEVEIPHDEWCLAWDNALNIPKAKCRYQELFQNALASKGIPCSYNSNSYRPMGPTSKKGIVKFRGYCRTAGKTISSQSKETDGNEESKCEMHYSFFLQKHLDGEPVKFVVEPSGTFVAIQKYNTSRQVKGVARDKMRNDAKHEKPKKLHLEAFSNIEDFQFLHGNLPTQGLGVIQKIRSESILDNSGPVEQTAEGLNSSVMALQVKLRSVPLFQSTINPEWNGFIHRICTEPHTVQLFTPRMIKSAILSSEFYLDSTGQMVKKLQGKQVLLHTLMAKGYADRAPPVPVLEFLAQSGTRFEVEMMLRDFTVEIRKVKPNWRPDLVVTDFSLAYLHAVSMGFNEISLSSYINQIYDAIVENQHEDGPPRTTMFVCTGHFLHAVSKHLKLKTLNRKAVQSAMHAFGHLIECDSLEKYKEVIDDILLLFGTKTLDEEVKNSIIKKLEENIFEFDTEEYVTDFKNTVKSDLDMETIPTEDLSRIQKNKIKFHKYFMARKEEIQSKMHSINAEESQKNEFYDEEIISTFERWNVYVPLWSKLAFRNSPPPAGNITTTYVENYFGQLKGSLHPIRNLREDVFINDHAYVADNFVSSSIADGFFVPLKKSGNKKSKECLPVRKKKPIANNKTKKQTDEIHTPYKRKNNPNFLTTGWGTKRKRGPAKYKKLFSKLSKASPRSSDATKKQNPVHGINLSNNSNLFGVSLDELTSLIPNKTDTKDGEIMTDPMEITSKPWNMETLPIEKLTKSYSEFAWGNEYDLLTLAPGSFVSSLIAGRMAKIIFESLSSEKPNTFVLDPLVIYGVDGEFAVDYDSLPDINLQEKVGVEFFVITFLDNHAILTHVDIGRQTLAYYDSLNHKSLERNELGAKYLETMMSHRKIYFATLTEAINTKYASDIHFNVVTGHSEEQKDNECVQMSLLNMTALLRGKNPKEIVSPLYAKVYREEIAKTLLSETDAGTHLLKFFNNDFKTMFGVLKSRAAIRSQVTALLKKRNHVADMLKEARKSKGFKENIKNPQFSRILEQTEKLRVEIQKMDTEWLNICSVGNSFLCRNTLDEIDLKHADVTEEKPPSPSSIQNTQANSPPDDDLHDEILDPTTLLAGISLVGKTLQGNAVLTEKEKRFQQIVKKIGPHGVAFPELKQKQAIYNEYSSNILRLTPEMLRERVVECSSEIQHAFENEGVSVRLKLYKEGDFQGRLGTMEVSEPFTTEQYQHVYELVSDMYFKKKTTEQYPAMVLEITRKVLIPETLIRIFAKVNKVTFSQAEEIMKRGPYFKGSLTASANEEI